MNNFEKRISYTEDLKPFLEVLCQDYGIGNYFKHKIVEVGYEDFNLILETSKQKYFIKIFADFRNNEECGQYVDKIRIIIKAGVNHPQLFNAGEGELYIKEFAGYEFRLVVMEYIDAESFYQSKVLISEENKRFIIQQAATINSIDFHPPFIYDSWALVNIEQVFEKTKSYLTPEMLVKIEPLVEEYGETLIKNLPHCFVHGDIMRTNVIKDKSNKLYLLDFGCSNYYPRIIELAVLFCDILFDEDNIQNEQNYQLGLEEYQKKIKLTEFELKTLPLFNKIAQAMYILCGVYEKKVKNNNSSENNHWIELGMKGLGIK